ncbi:hypothetical protein GCM10007972_10160 [Iodidimonas muriae]|uniref:ArsC family reductase n=1 Tax=Iodidimonas muriae TaxID=261467 RepID=A0ABQ2LCA2_9PROT|nr:hypothetical protein JCM17843_23540 [Kordiimonadales bacterium JCM 17843]GGO09048.1 hypothetical protein GCM10007972_10160 [Iodidimonas muriae]
MIILFGLKNCDRCRKARKWLDQTGADYQFVDVRDQGIEDDLIDRWIDAVGWEALLNRRGTTWRGLDEEVRQAVDGQSARALMMAHPALVKRPVWDLGTRIVVGFDDSIKSLIGAPERQA